VEGLPQTRNKHR